MVGGKAPVVFPLKDCFCFYLDVFTENVLSCLVSLECTLWEGFFWRMPKQAYTVPCRASHPRGQGAQVLCT